MNLLLSCKRSYLHIVICIFILFMLQYVTLFNKCQYFIQKDFPKREHSKEKEKEHKELNWTFLGGRNKYLVPEWMKTCNSFYVDLGSNIGVQVKKLYDKYPPSKNLNLRKRQMQVEKLYFEAYGNITHRQNPSTKLCSFGFEPNPKHQKQLSEIEEQYRARGILVHFFPLAIGSEDKLIKFYTEDKSANEDYGATIFQVNMIKGRKTEYMIQVINFAEFLSTHMNGKTIDVMKMDIEGLEIGVLTDLLFKGFLCQSKITTIYIEYHKFYEKQRATKLFYTREDLLRKVKEQTQCKGTTIVEIDDESFLHDISLTPV